jgi:hypothetical protein
MSVVNYEKGLLTGRPRDRKDTCTAAVLLYLRVCSHKKDNPKISVASKTIVEPDGRSKR